MSKKRKNKIKKRTRLDGFLDLFALGILIATLFGFLGDLSWFFDLFSHFRVQYMQLCLVPFFIAMWKQRNRSAIALVVLVCVNYAFVFPLYLGKPDPTSEKPIRAMLMNLNAGNGNTDQVLASIRMADPDLLLLEEVTPKWVDELDILNSDYEYRLVESRNDPFGIMLLSKYPLKNGRIVEIGPAGVPSVTADVYFPQGEVSLIGTHPLPPIGAEYSRNRNEQLAALPAIVKEQNYPVLLIGDLNTTPWTPHFKRLVNDSGLKNSMKGFGHQPSWPSGHFFLRIPLDHILHAPEIAIHNRMVARGVGSDHFPIIVDFSIE